MDVYLVVVVLNPTAKEKHDDGAVPSIIVQPQAVIAKDESQAAFKAQRLIPQEYDGKEDRLEVRVLPFARVAAGVR